MSAFFVGTAHINAMLTAAEHFCRGSSMPDPSPDPANADAYPRVRVDRDELTAVGKMLLAENVASLRARYPSDWQEMVDVDVNKYRFRPDFHWAMHAQAAIRTIKLISCYEYQSCEHDGWKDSRAREWCLWFQDALIGKLPGYDSAPWGYDGPPADAPRIVSLFDMATGRA